MTQIMKQITAFLWLLFGLPLFIGLGGVHALDMGDYAGAIWAFANSLAMSVIIFGLLRLIYVEFYNHKIQWQNRIDFAHTILLGFVYAGTIYSVCSMLLRMVSPPANLFIGTMQIVSVPIGLGSIYLLWGYLVPKTKKLRY